VAALRAARAAGFAALSLSAGVATGAVLGACFDVFHSTADIVTACDVDGGPAACQSGERAEMTTSETTDFCTWTHAEARAHAERACSWLGACEAPVGRNAFGTCMFQALMAYDCASNPNHQARGEAQTLWQCLQSVDTCRGVDACVFPVGPQNCDVSSLADYTRCSNRHQGGSNNDDVRVECTSSAVASGQHAYGENCALFGQTCVDGVAGGVCVGDDAGLHCAGAGCFGKTKLSWCGDAGGQWGNVGLDCASNGAGSYGVFPDAGQWVACLAETDAGASAACAPSLVAACDGGVASSCPSGVRESIDCATLLGAANACAPGPLTPPFDWTSACQVSPPVCTADSCGDGGATLTGCARGAMFSTDCYAEGLGSCRTVTTDTGSQLHAACGPPPSGKDD
jgi:hypothetical protein